VMAALEEGLRRKLHVEELVRAARPPTGPVPVAR